MGSVVFNASQSNVDVNTADPSQLLLNPTYPFHKLDVTNPVSFQNFNVTFAHDTPNPANPGIAGDIAYLATQIYSFPHGYKYIPAVWVFGLTDVVYADQVTAPAYQNGNLINLGSLTGGSGGWTEAALWIHPDDVNVNISVIKGVASDTNGNFPSPAINIVGFIATLRIYCFVEDLQQN